MWGFIIAAILLILSPGLIMGLLGLFLLIIALALGVGAIISLPVGIFNGIKTYWASIGKNINNNVLKIIMKFVTPVLACGAIIFMLIYTS